MARALLPLRIVIRAVLAASLVLGLSQAASAQTCERVAVWRDGRPVEDICAEDARAAGYTILDLGDDWVPPVIAGENGDDEPAYATTYRALAQERFDDAPSESLARYDRYLEMYGVVPSLGVVRRRMDDQARHRCHAAIDNAALDRAPEQVVEETAEDATARQDWANAMRARLVDGSARVRIPDLTAGLAIDPELQGAAAQLISMEAYAAAVRTVQAHLACDLLLGPPTLAGAYTPDTSHAVAAFQRGAMIVPTGELDAATREAIAEGSSERDFRTALRVLRERVVAASGLLEDGSAGDGPGTVLGRTLDAPAMWSVRGHEPLAGAAPDLVSPATEAAALALGWTDAEAVRAFLDRMDTESPGGMRVAVALPPPPAYHGPQMELSVEIDRGDVYKDHEPTDHDVERRPALIVYAKDGGRRIALVRWPTTIGGWQDTKIGDRVVPRFKGSPVGRRVWRDLYVAPSWLAPRSTPDEELVRSFDGMTYELNREVFGPSYRGAFGLVAFVHRDGHDRDGSIRTHATGNLPSLDQGNSHGCHRLMGIHAVRLANFVLAHHEHVRHGQMPAHYRRVVEYGGSFPVELDDLGYRIQLVPPIPVTVLPGRVHD